MQLTEEEMKKVQAVAKTRPPFLGETSNQQDNIILMTGVSKKNNFAALVDVYVQETSFSLLADTGNDSLIFPYPTGIAIQDPETGEYSPKYPDLYKIVDANAHNNWHEPSLLMRGPVKLGWQTFYADFFVVTAPGPDQQRHANLGLNFMSKFQSVTPPMQSAGWNYMAIELNADETEGMPLLSESFRVHQVPSKLHLTMSDAVVVSPWSMMSLQSYPVAAVKLQSIRFDRTLGSRPWDVDMENIPYECVAFVDTGGGMILASFRESDDPFLKLESNAKKPETWTPVSPTPGELRLLHGLCEMDLTDSTGTAVFTVRVPDCHTPDCMLVSAPGLSYLNGKYGVNIGGLSFLYMRAIFDIKGGKVGFVARQPTEVVSV